jgi:hypothetical protein
VTKESSTLLKSASIVICTLSGKNFGRLGASLSLDMNLKGKNYLAPPITHEVRPTNFGMET